MMVLNVSWLIYDLDCMILAEKL